MRILFWTEAYEPLIGGVEIVVKSLAVELIRQGHEAMVLTNQVSPNHTAVETIDGVSIHRFPLMQAAENRDLRILYQARSDVLALKRSFKPDVEHVHSIGPLLMVHQMVRKNAPSPVITSMHCLHNKLHALIGASGAARALLSQSHYILTATALLRSAVVDQMPDLANRVRVSPIGVPPSPYLPAPLSFNPPILHCCGRLVREKGFDVALHALPHIQQQFPAVRLIITGDGPERRTLEKLAVELGVAASVDFIGWVPPADLSALVNRTTLTLIPSRWEEPFGVVVLESTKMGRPVIATAVGGTHENALHGLIAKMVENENSDALAAATCELLRAPEQTHQIGLAARKTTLENYSFSHYFETHLRLYQQAANAGSTCN